ncbi:MAG: HEAT repeat domain-containing protein [Pirellulaceae bacterium]
MDSVVRFLNGRSVNGFSHGVRVALFGGVALLSLAVSACACQRPEWETPEPRTPVVAEASDEGRQAMQGFQKPAGIEVGLFAAEPDVANMVAIYVDLQGRVWVCESFRQKVGIEDNRGHEHWLDDDLAARTVEDRYAYIQKHIPNATRLYTENDDRIRLLIDEDGDHVADRATVFADHFNEVVSGTGAGVLAYRDQVYYTCIPDLWMLVDEDSDGVADSRRSLHYGFGVRFAFRGHDMHGLTIGPDGRLYFSIGDRGYNVETMDGQGENPESGAVFRCELDGSRLEVFASGLRNPQELAFDDFGNLFTGDNNSDSGDQARWVHVVQGGDSGWRMAYQYLPDRGPFNREKIWHPAHPGQPAYIVPPIVNFADGPSGLTYYPGTGLGDEYLGRFFLCDFRGQASNSGIRSFRLEPKGASFEMVDATQPFWNILATDADFGPDGALYVADWVHGWDGLDKGRIYRFSNPEAAESEIVRETQQLLNNGMEMTDEVVLVRLLGHQDKRVRQEAQFELARRNALEALDGVARHGHTLLARVHAIWGIGQIARRDIRLDEISETLSELMTDRQSEVRAQACSLVGDLRDRTYAAQLQDRVLDAEPRVRYFAALAVGRLEYPAALPAVLRLLEENADQDVVLRHAGIMALRGIAIEDRGAVRGLAQHPSLSVRIAATVALRKIEDSGVAEFLNDADPLVVVEAARAIHDTPIVEAWPRLAALIKRPSEDDALMRRVLSVNYQLGGQEQAESLAEFATETRNEAWAIEAINLLAYWPEGIGRDRVLGMWRPVEARDVTVAREALNRHLSAILSRGGAVADRAIDVAGSLGIDAIIPSLRERVADGDLAGHREPPHCGPWLN